MPRRLSLICNKCETISEVVVGIEDPIPRCNAMLRSFGEEHKCRGKREIYWDEEGPTGAPGFRIKGMSKKF